MAGNETRPTEVGPDSGQIFFDDAKHVDALAAGDFDSGNVELVNDVSDSAQFLGTSHATPHARHNRVGAILLNVGMHALVDEARLVVVGILTGPVADEIIVQCRTAFGAATGRRPMQFLHHGGNGL